MAMDISPFIVDLPIDTPISRDFPADYGRVHRFNDSRQKSHGYKHVG